MTFTATTLDGNEIEFDWDDILNPDEDVAYIGGVPIRVSTIAARRAEGELAKALKFYADHDNYSPKSHPFPILETATPVSRDAGKLARAALAQNEKA